MKNQFTEICAVTREFGYTAVQTWDLLTKKDHDLRAESFVGNFDNFLKSLKMRLEKGDL